MLEKRKHMDAFSYWFALTEKGHSVSEAAQATAEHCGVNERTIWAWHEEFDWKQRAIEKRAEINKYIEEQENQTLAENRSNYLKILHKLLDNYIKDGFPVQIETVKDLETVIKNCLVLQDAPTEVVKNNTTQINVDAESLFDEDLMMRITKQEEEIDYHEEDEQEGLSQ